MLATNIGIPALRRHRIAFVITDVSGGGAARVAVILCKEWVTAGHEVHLITYEEPGTPSFYEVDECVFRHQLGLVHSAPGGLAFITTNVRRVGRLRAILRDIRPTAVIAFLLEANVTSILASTRLDIPVLVAERNHPAHHHIPAIKAKLRNSLYSRAARLCVQSEDIRRWFIDNIGLDASVIANPVISPDLVPRRNDRRASGRQRIIGLGRLEPQKGFDRVINAFSAIQNEVPDWELVIFGEGEARADLASQIERSGLTDRVRLPGQTATPMAELREADLFIHAARYEGYPNVIIEALSAGLCVIATDSPGATGEILAQGRGLLVADGDSSALSSAMLLAMRDRQMRETTAARAQTLIRSLAPARIAQLWIEEIERSRV